MPAEYLECNVCHVVYDDQGSIDMAKNGADQWKRCLAKDNIEAKGISPCPNISCPGELQLKTK